MELCNDLLAQLLGIVGDDLKAIKSIKMIKDEKITAYSLETFGTFDLESELALISYYLILNLHR